jgi:hypothetical protein
VVVATVLEPLSTEGPDPYGLRGVRKALAAHGFEVSDVILKRVAMPRGLEPAAYTYEESRLNTLESRLKILDSVFKEIDEQLKLLAREKKLIHKGTDQSLAEALAAQSALAQAIPVAELAKQALEQLKQLPAEDKAEIRRQALERNTQAVADITKAREQFNQDRQKKLQERGKLDQEALAEQRRMTDVGAKLERLLADCDLLIVPRHTILSLSPTFYIPNDLHQLDPAQVKAIRAYLKRGKPMLACFGPANEAPQRRRPPTSAGPDGMEDLLADLGIRLGKETVLYDVEAESLAGSPDDELEVPAAPEPVPPVAFGWQRQADRVQARINPIRSSLRVAAHSVGKDLDLEIRYPRPVYYEGKGRTSIGPRGRAQDQPAVEPEFMKTSPESWREAQPFPVRGRTPLPAADKRGPISIGVAVESPIPATWSDKGQPPSAGKVRVAAIGHGGWFVGEELSPAKEKLLLDVSNWLLHRNELLVEDTHPWRYPRVALDENEQQLWHWGAQLGLPGLFVYLGLAVLMLRRLR